MVRPSAREAATQAGRALLNLLPVMGFLSLVDPSLRNADPNAAAAIAAQKRLGEIQGRVRKLIEAEPDIQSVSWRVDADWFAQHGVRLQQ